MFGNTKKKKTLHSSIKQNTVSTACQGLLLRTTMASAVCFSRLTSKLHQSLSINENGIAIHSPQLDRSSTDRYQVSYFLTQF